MEVDYLCGTLYGVDNHLKIIGFERVRRPSGKCAKRYFVQCKVCIEDSELFGDAVFTTERGSLNKGKTPCGCSSQYFYTEEQFKVLCQRASKSSKYKFLGFSEKYKGSSTKLRLECPDHGVKVGTILKRYEAGAGCHSCSSRITTEEFTHRCMQTGKFPEGSIFTRAYREGAKFPEDYWDFYCPKCLDTFQTKGSNLIYGHVPCNCPIRFTPPKYAYINILLLNNEAVALKFGISCQPEKRLKQLSSGAIYTIVNSSVWLFNSVNECRDAERFCMKELVTGVVIPENLPVGWTETTLLENETRIAEIYEIFGGKRLTQ